MASSCERCRKGGRGRAGRQAGLWWIDVLVGAAHRCRNSLSEAMCIKGLWGSASEVHL